MIYVFDIDGTLADASHRLHLITSKLYPKDWEAFFAACVDDKPIWEVITVARALAAAGHTIVYATGRPERTRTITSAWLLKYRVPLGTLYMRDDTDHREDTVVKSEMLDKIIHSIGANIVGGIFEDRQGVTEMYRARGLRVFQVAEGKY